MGSAMDFMADAGSIRDALELRRLRLSEAADLLAAVEDGGNSRAGVEDGRADRKSAPPGSSIQLTLSAL
jgi:hypothetical protein